MAFAAATRLPAHGHSHRTAQAPLSVRRLRVLLFAGAVLLYIALAYIGPEQFLPAQSNDAASVSELSTSVEGIEAGDGYATMALIYQFTTPSVRQFMLFLIACGFFYAVIRNVTNMLSAGLAAFLCFTPILMFLCYFVKDSLYIPFVLLVCLLAHKMRSIVGFYLITALVFLVFSFLFRQYFIIVTAMMIALAVFRQSPRIGRVLIILAVPAILLAIPPHIYTFLQDQRDWVNESRIGLTGSGTRTAFMNYMPPEGAWSFLVNYGYAILRLNLPIFFGAGAKELYLMATVFALALLAFLGLRSPDRRIWRPATIFLAHGMTLMLFEPDLGSYLRHITTSLPFVAPALALMKWSVRPSRRKLPKRSIFPRRPRSPSRNNSGHRAGTVWPSVRSIP